jgi:Ser/Thr protein kinase RdoA (MazF antagonist)
MAEYFPATYSTLSVKALLEMVSNNYKLENLLECKLLNHGLNDTYLLKTTANKHYIIRVYRTRWRSLSDISYELDVLMHLHQHGVHVSIPLPRRDNEFIQTVTTIEGTRYVVLFTFASGREPSYEDEKQAIQYGRAVALVHAATDGFISKHSRFSLDLNHLLHSPMKEIQPILSRRHQDWEYLEKLYDKLCSTLKALPLCNLEQGFCHGDFHGWNANIEEDGTLTFYDFDCGGSGWRAYDVAVFRWCAMLRDKEKERWELFLQGYREVKELKQIDIEAVPYFIGVRHIWIMGLHAANAYDLGYGWLNDDYYDHQMKFLHRWDTEFFNERKSG